MVPRCLKRKPGEDSSPGFLRIEVNIEPPVSRIPGAAGGLSSGLRNKVKKFVDSGVAVSYKPDRLVRAPASGSLWGGIGLPPKRDAVIYIDMVQPCSGQSQRCSMIPKHIFVCSCGLLTSFGETTMRNYFCSLPLLIGFSSANAQTKPEPDGLSCDPPDGVEALSEIRSIFPAVER